ncbi:MAG TPA: 50S ribosomal protein L18 [Candidatus Sumerlaeota bacterium]|nr:MAG: 50S ribosomal protein L18 [candidate division BRC1 bacterium ADurb.Bin183]HOE64710.1 50S ribosomal protein L18 [Candidatus Sumerlaeota bacterium]HRR31602.1 50S ribosomal protein L18 [Candidatus Sumerlaeia bacterium]HON51417.1 50S ribosomal protein L18 [Candidatus Sumerlaeota bacterium]HOR64530.1 50S ribosomal protein L18 [Candidatus Sumerlaeota bacterium]
MKRTKELRRKIRHYRIRKRIIGSADRPRICVHKSLKHLYISVLDDATKPEGSIAIMNLTTNTKANKAGDKKSFCNVANAKTLGLAAGKALLEKGIKQAVFDRAGYRYHGCVKAIAEAVREAGVIV